MSLRNRILLLSAVAQFQFCPLYSSESRVYAFLTVKDYCQACQVAEALVLQSPQSPDAWHACVSALAMSGEEIKALQAYKKYRVLQPEARDNRELLEAIAWGSIEKASRSNLPLVRLFAALGAFSGQDARGVQILKRSLTDSNPRIRAAAAELSSHFRDSVLQDEVLRLFATERNPYVRIEIIKALGRMKISEAEHHLTAILNDKSSEAEEKAAATEALVSLMEKAERKEIEGLVSSSRAGLRELACQVVACTIDCCDGDLLLPLLKDHSSDVRMAAVQVLGGEEQRPLLADPDPYVAISAARALTIAEGKPYLKPWLNHPNQAVRYCAAGALASAGPHGIFLMEDTLRTSRDPYVRINLVVGLIGQRKQSGACAAILEEFLTHNSDKVAWEKKGMIRYLSPSHVKNHPFIPNRPEQVNQAARLDLLNLLALLDDGKAVEAARSFLKNRVWGISGMTAELILSEGDEYAIGSVEKLLDDPNPRIRVQSALILAFWEKSEKAVSILQAAYPGADRETKEKILESLGAIGSEASVPFLVEALETPSQTMRIIAASSLIKCLYH